MRLPKKVPVWKKIVTKINSNKIFIIPFILVITLYITVLFNLDSYINIEYIDTESIISEIEENKFYNKQVFIVTYIDTIEVDDIQCSNGVYKIYTRHGIIETDEFDGGSENVTVYIDIEGNIDYIGNITKNKYIRYVIYGYKKVNSDTIIINSRTNKEGYLKYVRLLEKYDRAVSDNEKLSNYKKSVKLNMLNINTIILIAYIFILVLIKYFMSARERRK